MEENTWKVYRHTFPDGKVYIGITKNDPKERWGTYGRGYQGQTKMFNAILAHGWNNIKHEILFENLSALEASAKEQELIKESDAGTGNYNYTYAKHETHEKPNGKDDTVITEQSLWRYGKYATDLPDMFYDGFEKKYGSGLSSVRLENNGAVFEMWRTAAGGYESFQMEADYPKEGMTFGDAKEWLIDCAMECMESKKAFISDAQIKENLQFIKGGIT